MVKLSVNINKIGTLRNARGGDNPDLVNIALKCIEYGADGITIHPRPDQRHIKYEDVPLLKKAISVELNIEGNPTLDFIDLVLKNKPAQVTLVPDEPSAITSNAGWNTKKHQDYLKEIISVFKKAKIRTSIFLDPDLEMVKYAANTGTDRIELYTEDYAKNFNHNSKNAIAKYSETAAHAYKYGLGVNAGHDLDLDNLQFFANHVPQLIEVSIGHALICDSILFGLNNTIQMYKSKLLNELH